MLCWKFYSILCQMIWILTFPAEYRISFAERVAIQTIQLTSEDYQHLKYWVYPKYREYSIFWVTWYPMIFKTEPGWVLEKVSRSGRVLGTHWALLMTRGRMNSSEVDYSGCVKNIMVVLSVRPVSLPRRMLCAPRRTRTFPALFMLSLIFRLYDILADSYC